MVGWWWVTVLCKFTMRPIHHNFCRLPREARFVREGKPMNDVKVHTSGAVSLGHPVVGKVEKIDFRVNAGLTHGQPTSAVLLSTSPFITKFAA